MSKTKIKVGFAGTPKIAFDIFNEILLSDEISTEFVLTQPDKLSGRGLTASKSLFINSAKLPVLQPDDLNSKDLVDKIKDFGRANNRRLCYIIEVDRIRSSAYDPVDGSNIDAVNNGVTGVAIVDARSPHACLFEIFTDKGAGTLIRK